MKRIATPYFPKDNPKQVTISFEEYQEFTRLRGELKNTGREALADPSHRPTIVALESGEGWRRREADKEAGRCVQFHGELGVGAEGDTAQGGEKRGVTRYWEKRTESTWTREISLTRRSECSTKTRRSNEKPLWRLLEVQGHLRSLGMSPQQTAVELLVSSVF